MGWPPRRVRRTQPATANARQVHSDGRDMRRLAKRTAQQLHAPLPDRMEVEWTDASSSPTAPTFPCRDTPGETRRALPTAGGASGRGSASRWRGSPYCCRAGDQRLPRPGQRAVRGKGHRRDHTACGRCTTRCLPGDVVLADALFGQLFPRLRVATSAGIRTGRPCRWRGRVGSPNGREQAPKAILIVWQRPNKPRGHDGAA